MLFKSTMRTIKSTFGRFFAIMAIVALGVGFFGGLKVTKPQMVNTLNGYLNKQRFFDYKLLSTYGFEKEDIEKLRSDERLSDALNVEGAYSIDALIGISKENESPYKIMSMTSDVNKNFLCEGRLPQNPGECVADNYKSSIQIGDVLTVSSNNDEDTLDILKNHELTVVGIVRNPLYINFERGTTSIGTGKLGGYICVRADEFDSEYYTEAYVYMKAGEENNSIRYGAYTEEYDKYIESHTDEVEEALQEIIKSRYNKLIDEANEELRKAKDELADQKKEAEDELSDALTKIEDGEKEIEEARNDIEEGRKKLQSSKKELNSKKTALEQASMFVEALEYETSMGMINEGLKQIKDKERELEDALNTIEEKEEELEDGRREYEEALNEFDEKIGEAENKILDAQKEIDDIEEPKTYVLDRNTNIGYLCFDSDADIVESVANVFPIFFLLVAILICMTTMNRMVEDERTQIGVLKALGYSGSAIGFKYIFYATSAALIGAFGGYILGSKFLPLAIWQGYNIMYNMGNSVVYLSVDYIAVISVAVAVLSSAGTAFFSVKAELFEVPANLIRPKAPRGGKRVFLEKITPVWSRMNFLSKVSFRNIIRYKKRFFMMILGIGGCTALVLTGIGLGDSIKGIANLQFDNIQIYDISVTFKDEAKEDELESIRNDSAVKDIVFMREVSLDANANDLVKGLSVMTPQNASDMVKFLVLRESEKGPSIAYPQNGGVITQAIAQYLGVEKGDEVVLTDSDMNSMTVPIVAVTENHFSSFIYLPEGEYFNNENKVNAAWINIKGDYDAHEFAAALSKKDGVLSVSVTQDTKDRVDTMLSAMDFIVWVVIACAGALAFIVLYNLTNINITERIREIATIKVLGFYPMECAAYVFRENMVLTLFGALVGLPLGKLLHKFIMYNIRIDMVYFKTYIAPQSYVYAVVMTFVFAMVVNVFMYFKLIKINMAESLKSIE